MAVVKQTEDFPYLPSGPAEVNKMIKEHGDLFSDSQCKVCSAVLISESQKLTHYQSKKHANKMRRYLSMQNEEPSFKKLKSSSEPDCNNGDADRTKACPLCNMTFSSPVIAESHYQGKVHAKKMKLMMVGLQVPVASQKAPATPMKKRPADEMSSVPAMGSCNKDNNNNPDRFCSICQASFNNPLMAQQHYEGKKHRKRMTKLKLMETYGPSTAPASTQQGYQCSICKIELNSVEQYQSHISGAKHKNQMKKLGMTASENQQSAEQSDSGSNMFTSGDEQYTAAEDQFAPANDQYAPANDQYAPVDYQYETGDEQFAIGDNQYTPEDKQYSEEYQYT